MRVAAPLFAAVGLLAVSLTARAEAPSARVMVIMDERVNGERSGAGGAEPELSKRFIAAGFQVVERYESEGVASRIPLERILHGDVSNSDVSAINADVLVVGRVSLRPEALPYGITGMEAFAATMEVRVLLTDSGRVIFAGTKSGKAASDSATLSGRVAGQLFEELLPLLKKGMTERAVIELRVAGLRSADAADQLAAKLAKSAGVQGAKVRSIAGNLTIIDLSARGTDVAALGGALAAAGLKVSGRTANVINARFDAVGAARRSLLVATFRNGTGNRGLDWIASMGPEVFETELSNSKYLAPKPVGARPGADPQAAAAAARAAGADLALIATLERMGNQLRFTSKVLKAQDGTQLAAAQVFGDEGKAVDLVKELVWKLDQQLFQKLNPGSDLDAYEAKVGKYARVAQGGETPAAGMQGAAHAAAAAGRVVVADTRFDPIFPSQLARYANEPFGEVTLQNVGTQAATAIRVGIEIEDLSGAEQLFRVQDLAPGATAKVPLKVVFDRRKMIDVSQRRPVRVQVTVRFHDGRQESSDTLSGSTVLHDRNAMNWKDGGAIAAFVTHRDPFVQTYARNAMGAAGEDYGPLPKGLRPAVALLDSMQALGIRYQRDPVGGYGEQAVDAIQFPRETLTRKAGDCDDLAVLYASLLSAAGSAARMVLTPGHIFVAVDSELPFGNAQVLGGAARTIELDGHAWVPVEITKLEGGFATAWAAGVEEIGRYRASAGQITYVDVADAWKRYEPFPVEGPNNPPAAPAGLAAKVRLDARAIAQGKIRNDESTPLPEVTSEQVNAAKASAGNDARTLVRSGAAAARRKEYAQALANLRAATELGDEKLKAAAYNNLGNVYAMNGHYDRAIEAYRSATSDQKVAKQAQTNLGFALFKAGNPEARSTLERVGTKEARQLMAQLGMVASTVAPPRQPTGRPGPGRTPPGPEPAVTGRTDMNVGMRADAGRVTAEQVLLWSE